MASFEWAEDTNMASNCEGGFSGVGAIVIRAENEYSMTLERNRIPDDVKRIHLIAACGTGMGALACMLKDLGYEVTGSDQRAYPPMSRFLEDKGIIVSDGFHEDNLLYGPDREIAAGPQRAQPRSPRYPRIALSGARGARHRPVGRLRLSQQA